MFFWPMRVGPEVCSLSWPVSSGFLSWPQALLNADVPQASGYVAGGAIRVLS